MEFDFFEHKGILHFFFSMSYALGQDFFLVIFFFPFCKGILQKRAKKIMMHGKVKQICYSK